jgi:hypothetical protein
VLAGAERSGRLLGVEVVSGENGDRVDLIVVEQIGLVGSGHMEAKSPGDVGALVAAGRDEADQLDSLHLGQGGEQDPGGEAPGAQRAETDDGGRGGTVERGRNRAAFNRQQGSFRVGDDHTEERLRMSGGDQGVGVGAPLDRNAVGDQRADVYPASATSSTNAAELRPSVSARSRQDSHGRSL